MNAASIRTTMFRKADARVHIAGIGGIGPSCSFAVRAFGVAAPRRPRHDRIRKSDPGFLAP